jgi:hypothetical protein
VLNGSTVLLVQTNARTHWTGSCNTDNKIDFTQSGMFPLQMLYALYKKFLEKYPNALYGRIAYITNNVGQDALMGGSVGKVATRTHSH